MSDAVREYYDTYWAGEGFYSRADARFEFAGLFGEYPKAGQDVLDVGCGDGVAAGLWAQSNGCNYVGVDLSANAVRAAQTHGLDARLIDDASILPFDRGSFDAAICLDVFEHLFEPHRAAVEIARVLKPDGLILATTPNAAYWRRRLELAAFGRFNPFGDELSMSQPWRDPHIRFFTIRSLRAMLTDADFEPVAARGFNGAFLRDIPYMRAAGRGNPSRLYRWAEARAPALLGLGIALVARKAS